jgi:hypothetical protein
LFSNIKKEIDQSSWPVFLIYFYVFAESCQTNLNQLNRILLMGESTIIFPQTLSFLGWFPTTPVAAFLMVCAMVVPLATLLNVNSRWLRVLNFLSFFLVKGFIFSAGRFSHQYWPLLWTLFFFSLPETWNSELDQRWIRRSYLAALLSVVLFYTYAGIWKVFSGMLDGSIFRSDFAANTFSYYLLSHGKKSWLGDFFISHELFSYISFLAVILFQISSPLIFFKKNYFRIWPFLILAFHFASLLLLQINFFAAGLVAFTLTFWVPQNIVPVSMRKVEES